MVDPRDTDPITLSLKTQARVESAALAADDCLYWAITAAAAWLFHSKDTDPDQAADPTDHAKCGAALSEAHRTQWRSLQSSSGARAGESSTRAVLLPCLAAPGSDCAEAEPFSLRAGGSGSAVAACEQDFAVRPPGPTGNRRLALIPLLPRGDTAPAAGRGREGPGSGADTSHRVALRGGWRVTARAGVSPPRLPQSPFRCVVRAARCLPRCEEGCGGSSTRHGKARCPSGTGELPAGGQAHGRPHCSLRAGKPVVSKLGAASYCQKWPSPGKWDRNDSRVRWWDLSPIIFKRKEMRGEEEEATEMRC